MSRLRREHTGRILRRELRAVEWDAPDLLDPIMVRAHARRPFISSAERERVARLRSLAGFMASAAVVIVSIAVFSPQTLRSAGDSIVASMNGDSKAGAMVASVEAPDPPPMSVVPTAREQAAAVAFAERTVAIARTMVSPAGEPLTGAGTITDQMARTLSGSELGPATPQ